MLDRGKQALDRLRSQVLVVLVIDLDHGRIDTGTQTFDFNVCKQTILGGVAWRNAQMFRDGLDDRIATAASELARCLYIYT